jgi:hypothetical protein
MNSMAQEDQAHARTVICAPAKLPAFFADDLEGTCAICQQPVRFRPHGPTLRVLVCLECYIVHAEPGAKCELLPEAAAELDALGIAQPAW